MWIVYKLNQVIKIINSAVPPAGSTVLLVTSDFAVAQSYLNNNVPKILSCALQPNGAAAPVIIPGSFVFNTLAVPIADANFSRVGPGNYLLTMIGQFTLGKTHPIISPLATDRLMIVQINDVDSIIIRSQDTVTQNLVDECYAQLIVNVYP